MMVEGEEVRSHDLGAAILTRSKKSKGNQTHHISLTIMHIYNADLSMAKF